MILDQVKLMETKKAADQIKLYNEGIKRISRLMQQRNFDHAFVIVDLLKQVPQSRSDSLNARVKSYCEIYPEETWAHRFINKKD